MSPTLERHIVLTLFYLAVALVFIGEALHSLKSFVGTAAFLLCFLLANIIPLYFPSLFKKTNAEALLAAKVFFLMLLSIPTLLVLHFIFN
jgi:hypothetical protein